MGFRTIHVSKRENPAISAGEIVEDRRKREIRQLFGPLSAGCVPLHFRGRSSRISTAHWLEQCYVRRPAAPASPRTSVKPAIGQTGGGVGDTRPSRPFCVDCDWLLADRAVVLFGRALALQRVNFSRWGERRANSLARSARSIEYFLSNVRSPLSCCSRW